MQSHRIRLVLATVVAVTLAGAAFTPSHLGLSRLGPALNIVNEEANQLEDETNSNGQGTNSTLQGDTPLTPSNSQQLEEESQRQRLQSPSDTSIPEPPSFAPPSSAPSSTSTTVPFQCLVRVIQTNSVVPIVYRVEVSTENGRSVYARISHDDEVEVFDIAVINERGSVLVKSFSRKVPTVEVFSMDSARNVQLGCRT